MLLVTEGRNGMRFMGCSAERLLLSCHHLREAEWSRVTVAVYILKHSKAVSSGINFCTGVMLSQQPGAIPQPSRFFILYPEERCKSHLAPAQQPKFELQDQQTNNFVEQHKCIIASQYLMSSHDASRAKIGSDQMQTNKPPNSPHYHCPHWQLPFDPLIQTLSPSHASLQILMSTSPRLT